MEEELMPTEVKVRPKNTAHGLECDITGRDVIDDAICLPKERSYLIKFRLDQESPWKFDTTNPFSARAGKCPPPDWPGEGKLKVTGTPTRDEFTVEAKDTGGSKKVYHYRLNFEGGRTYDPIIIRD